MMKIKWAKYKLEFFQPAGTSRGVLHFKETYLLQVSEENTEYVGIGECNLFKGLSYDDQPDYENVLNQICANPSQYVANIESELKDWPSIRFGLEMALLDYQSHGKRELFRTSYSQSHVGIPINGLIWMGEKEFMHRQIRQKLDAGFGCLKLKIGAINFNDELDLLQKIRKEFPSDVLELRVDANGAFKPSEALGKLEKLARFDLHSIEQPIRQGQVEKMAKLCKETPIPIALDEELIGILDLSEKKHLLKEIAPQYIILKPALVGGFKASEEWIELSEGLHIPWWITSALESNIGLSAISQWTSSFENPMYQGLGTGQLYTNNFPCPLLIKNAELWYSNKKNWDLSALNF